MPTQRLSMRRIREVLRLRHQGLTERVIARMLGVSNGVVHGYLRRARLAGLSWPLPEGQWWAKRNGRPSGTNAFGTGEFPCVYCGGLVVATDPTTCRLASCSAANSGPTIWCFRRALSVPDAFLVISSRSFRIRFRLCRGACTLLAVLSTPPFKMASTPRTWRSSASLSLFLPSSRPAVPRSLLLRAARWNVSPDASRWAIPMDCPDYQKKNCKSGSPGSDVSRRVGCADVNAAGLRNHSTSSSIIHSRGQEVCDGLPTFARSIVPKPCRRGISADPLRRRGLHHRSPFRRLTAKPRRMLIWANYLMR
jgi:hypothetical protein